MNIKRPNTLYLIFLSVFLLFLTGCNLFPLKPGPLSFRDADITALEEYAVISAAIDTLCAESDLVHIKQNTYQVPDSSTTSLDFYLDQTDLSDTLMRNDYLAKNDTTHYLDPSLINDPASLFSTDQFVYYFASSSSDMGFTGYYRDYPESSGIISLHRPGFNADGDMAMIEVSFFQNNLAAEGFLLIFEKTDEQWNLTWKFLLWIS